MSKGKKHSKRPPKFVTATFNEMKVATMFYSNGYLCIKTNAEDFMIIKPVNEQCVIVKWNELTCFDKAFIVNYTYSYKRN